MRLPRYYSSKARCIHYFNTRKQLKQAGTPLTENRNKSKVKIGARSQPIQRRRAMTEATKKLTEEQERIVWQHICGRITDDDRNPEEVIRENYNGDRSRYLR